MIVRWPGEIPAGKVSDFKWTSADFTPTAVEISYGQPAKNLDGLSILPVLQGKTGTNTVDVPDRVRPQF